MYMNNNLYVALNSPQKKELPKTEDFTIWLFNIAMGNDPFIDGFPIKNGDFPWLC